MYFDIYDPQCNQSANYKLRGISIGPATPVSFTFTAGDWTEFDLMPPGAKMTVKDFGGLARVLSAGAANESVTGVEISPMHIGVLPINVSVSTGFTFGASIGATAGIFTLVASCSGPPPDQWPAL
jgi:hypothetical protein